MVWVWTVMATRNIQEASKVRTPEHCFASLQHITYIHSAFDGNSATFWLLECWIFEINNHSNCSNGQDFSPIFSCYNVFHLYYKFLLPMEHYTAGNIQSAWNEWRMLSPSTFISPPWVRKCQSKWLNCLDRWPTVVLLLSTLRIRTTMVNLLVDQSHGSQLVTIFNCSEGCSPLEFPQCKL